MQLLPFGRTATVLPLLDNSKLIIFYLDSDLAGVEEVDDSSEVLL